LIDFDEEKLIFLNILFQFENQKMINQTIVYIS